MPGNVITTIKIAGAFVGLLLGSGFATGQESLQFFGAFGAKGLIGALIAWAVFIYLCRVMLLVGREHNLMRNEDVFVYFAGELAGKVFTWYTMVFIIAVIAVLLAGAGATLSQTFPISGPAATVGMAILSGLTLLLGLKKIIDIVGFIGPLIAVIALIVCAIALGTSEGDLVANLAILESQDRLRASGNWLLSGILYVGLSVLAVASFMAPVGAKLETTSVVMPSSVLGPTLLMGAMALVFLALAADLPAIEDQVIPMLALTDRVFPPLSQGYAILISLGIYTTVTPLLWSVCARFFAEGTTSYRVLVLVQSIVGILGGLALPFDQLLNLIYPTVGYVGLIFLGLIFVKQIRGQRVQHD